MQLMALKESVVNGKYPESSPFGGRVVYRILMKTGPEPCQGYPVSDPIRMMETGTQCMFRIPGRK